jgi:AbrB family looped-hinge helix DNA binding protein
METLTISPKYQVVIPKSILETQDLRPGQKVQAIVYNNRIEIIPIQPIEKLRGFVNGIDTDVERDVDRV